MGHGLGIKHGDRDKLFLYVVFQRDQQVSFCNAPARTVDSAYRIDYCSGGDANDDQRLCVMCKGYFSTVAGICKTLLFHKNQCRGILRSKSSGIEFFILILHKKTAPEKPMLL